LSVTLLNDPKGHAASAIAAGMLAPVTEVHYGEEALLRLNIESARRFPAFVGELEATTGVEVRYRLCGTLMVARDADDNAELDDLFAFQRELGLDIERVTSKQARTLEPGLASTIRGGIFAPNDHQVDPAELLGALRIACVASGVELIDRRAAGIRVDGDRVTAVIGDDGVTVAADQIVIAAGVGSGLLTGLPPQALPAIRPVKGQLVLLAARGPFGIADRNIRGLDVYVVSRTNGRVVVGATVEEMGYDATVTAGAVHSLLRDAYELLPGLAELRFVRAAAGLRPTTPDNAPLMGPGALDGLVVATGHFRNGVLLTPITGDTIAELLASGTAPDAIASFSPKRFAPEVAA
jgi:glycine oxidase